MKGRVRTSVVIASRDRPRELLACLRSVQAAISPSDEIIVVDSASRDSSATSATANSVGATVLRSELPGSARARNLGVASARGEFIAFTDDDARVDADWIQSAAKRFRDAAVAAVVGPVYAADVVPETPLFEFGAFDVSKDVVVFNRSAANWFSRVRLGAIGSGANLHVRRTAFEQHGLFRESLGAGAPIIGDENYFLLSLIEGGATVVHDPRTRVLHPSQSIERLKEVRLSYLAYVLYVFVTRGEIRSKVAVSFLRGLRRERSFGLKPARSIQLSEIVSAAWRAPRLVIAARQIDRRCSIPSLRLER